MIRNDTGLLLSDKNIKLHRQWFKQMTKLIGINVQYYAPKDEQPNIKEYNMYGELNPVYDEPITISCIFDEHPTEKTMRKLGWNAEMSDSTSVIHVQYDLPGLQVGAKFVLPAGIDNAEPRVFRVLRMSTIAVYPASVSCELGPLLENATKMEQVEDFDTSNFNLLNGESDEYGH